jgi:3D (Asp-Asp-Asp) domain-containing protein
VAVRAAIVCSLLLVFTTRSQALDYGLTRGTRHRPGSVILQLSATAYCHAGTTKSGVWTRPGIVAADPRIVPLRSLIRIVTPETYAGIYQVMDTGAAIKGRRLDLFIPSCLHAKRFGRQPVVIQLVDRRESFAP